jgi:hypothetical protein
MVGKKVPSPEEIREEQKRLRYLRTLVDLAANVIMQGGLQRREAERMVEAMRRQVLQLFPGKELVYDLVYRPRFERLIQEYTGSRGRSLGGKVLPFRKPEPASDF